VAFGFSIVLNAALRQVALLWQHGERDLAERLMRQYLDSPHRESQTQCLGAAHLGTPS
jgi:hypothetical protein